MMVWPCIQHSVKSFFSEGIFYGKIYLCILIRLSGFIIQSVGSFEKFLGLKKYSAGMHPALYGSLTAGVIVVKF